MHGRFVIHAISIVKKSVNFRFSTVVMPIILLLQHNFDEKYYIV